MNKAEFDIFAAEYAAMHEQSLTGFGVEKEYFAEYKIGDVAAELESLDLIARTRQIVDFGAGCGNSIPYFRRYLPLASLTCVDVSAESLAIAQRNYPAQAKFLTFDGVTIPISPESFDLAFSACVFHHIDHDEHVSHLSELHRVLRPGGALMVFEQNPLNPLTLYVVKRCPFDNNARLIRAKTLKARMIAAGFADVRIRFRLFVPPKLKGLRWIEKYLRWLPFGAQYYVLARKLPI